MPGIAKQGNENKGEKDLRPWFQRVRDARQDGGRGLKNGYRSGLEEKNAKLLESFGVKVEFEVERIGYVIPESKHHYTPDFRLGPNFFVETKGKFEPTDRMKHVLIKQQRQDVEIRFVFSRASDVLRKGSATTYSMWCDQHGFKWAHKLIPLAWVKEKRGNKTVVVSLID